MTKDEAQQVNKALDEFKAELDPIYEVSIEARNRAQEAISAIQDLRAKIVKQQIANLKSVVEP